MAAANPLYDLVLMLDTSAEDARRTEILESVRSAVSATGEIVNTQDWGPRTLSFEIDKKKDADYHLLQFHATSELLTQLDRTLRITDEVLRFRVIKLAPGTPAPPEQRAEPRASGIGSSEEADGSAEEAAPVVEDADSSSGDAAPVADSASEDAAPVAEDADGPSEAAAPAAEDADGPSEAAAPAAEDADGASEAAAVGEPADSDA